MAATVYVPPADPCDVQTDPTEHISVIETKHIVIRKQKCVLPLDATRCPEGVTGALEYRNDLRTEGRSVEDYYNSNEDHSSSEEYYSDISADFHDIDGGRSGSENYTGSEVSDSRSQFGPYSERTDYTVTECSDSDNNNSEGVPALTAQYRSDCDSEYHRQFNADWATGLRTPDSLPSDNNV